MADTKHTGGEGQLEVGPTPIGFTGINTWELGREQDELDASEIDGTNEEDFIYAGPKRTLTVNGWYRDGNAGQALIRAADNETPVQIIVYPEGKTTGARRITGNWRIGSITEGAGGGPRAVQVFNFVATVVSGTFVDDTVP